MTLQCTHCGVGVNENGKVGAGPEVVDKNTHICNKLWAKLKLAQQKDSINETVNHKLP